MRPLHEILDIPSNDLQIVMNLENHVPTINSGNPIVFKTKHFIEKKHISLIGTSRIDGEYIYRIDNLIDRRKTKLKEIIIK